MNDPFRGFGRVLSHHGPEEAHHTLQFRVGAWRVALCARCTALYPTLVAVVLLETWVRPLPLGPRWFWVYALVTPAVVDYGRARLFSSPGANWIRVSTGGLAGIGLGMGFSDYFREPGCMYFWVLLGVLAVGNLWILVIVRGGRRAL